MTTPTYGEMIQENHWLRGRLAGLEGLLYGLALVELISCVMQWKMLLRIKQWAERRTLQGARIV